VLHQRSTVVPCSYICRCCCCYRFLFLLRPSSLRLLVDVSHQFAFLLCSASPSVYLRAARRRWLLVIHRRCPSFGHCPKGRGCWRQVFSYTPSAPGICRLALQLTLCWRRRRPSMVKREGESRKARHTALVDKSACDLGLSRCASGK